MTRCPTLVIAGTHSGAGKTSFTLALARALARRGRETQTFKVGPDFLDPTYLALASGRPCYNLDGWMAGHDHCRRLFARATSDADCALVEGVMGLFDGADVQSDEGSTAEIARLLDAPVILVVNVHGMGRSFAALVKGYTTFQTDLRFTGVVANHCGVEEGEFVAVLGSNGSGKTTLIQLLVGLLKAKSGQIAIAGRAARSHFRVTPEQVMEVGNEWGFAIDEAAREPFAALLIVGHPGKLAKLTAGDWDTHSGRSGSALPIVAEMHAAILGRPAAETPTVEGIFAALDGGEKKMLGNTLAAAIQKAVGKRTEGRLNAAVVLIDLGGRNLGEAGDLIPWG